MQRLRSAAASAPPPRSPKHNCSSLITGATDPNLLRNMTERGIPVRHQPLDLEKLQTYLEDLTGQAA